MMKRVFVLIAVSAMVCSALSICLADSSLWDKVGPNFNRDKSDEDQLPVTFKFQKECGSPIKEGMIWAIVEGYVIAVPNGNTLVIRLKGKNNRKIVHLVAIESPSDNDPMAEDVRQFLESSVQSKQISILINPNSIEDSELIGVIKVSGIDMNYRLLELGLVRYQEPERYMVSNYLACMYRMIEKEARNNNLGIWKKNHGSPLGGENQL